MQIDFLIFCKNVENILIVKTNSIILNSMKYSESSKILRVFTRDYGKISLIAKGAISSKNKYGSAIEPLSISEIQFYFKKNTDLYLVSSAETKIHLKIVRNELDRIAVGMMILESISQAHEENDKNEELFDEILNSFELLNTSEFSPILAFAYFEIKHCKILGFDLNFEFLDLERRDLKDFNINFSIFNSTIAKNLDIIKGNSIKLNALSIEFMCLIDENNLIAANKIASNYVLNDLVKIFSAYYSYHFDKKFGYRSFALLT